MSFPAPILREDAGYSYLLRRLVQKGTSNVLLFTQALPNSLITPLLRSPPRPGLRTTPEHVLR